MSAKQHRAIRASVSRDGRPQSIEQHDSYDDNSLPDAAELSRLKEIDPNIVDWLKSRSDKEQDARLSFNNRRMTVLEKMGRRGYHLDLYRVTCALLIVLVGMGLSFFLIKSGGTTNILVGSIFAGGTLLFTAKAFLGFRDTPTENKKK